MTDTGRQPLEVVAQSVVDDATHYVESVAAMAEDNDLTASNDIVSASGIKLVARGMQIDAHLREKLRSHRLTGMTLEQCLTVAEGVTPESLAIDMARLIDEDSWFKHLAAACDDPGALRHGAAYLNLPPEILFRLTVAREQRPKLYSHSISAAVIGHYLALRLSLNQATVNNVLIAALCHDLGELYVDPAILAPAHRITDAERRFIYVHPLAGWLMVRELPGVDAEVATAIVQHQERVDGSGYPNGKKAAAIGMPGRILAAADVAASIMARFGDHRRLSTLVRLNVAKYDPAVISLLYGIAVPEDSPPGALQRDVVASRLAGFAMVLEGWARLRASTELGPDAFGEFLSERMFNLRIVIVQFGFDPDSLETPLKLAEEDPTIATELTAVVDELQFQLADLGREFDRRAPGFLEKLDPLVAQSLLDWRKQLQDCIDG